MVPLASKVQDISAPGPAFDQMPLDDVGEVGLLAGAQITGKIPEGRLGQVSKIEADPCGLARPTRLKRGKVFGIFSGCGWPAHLDLPEDRGAERNGAAFREQR